MYNVDYIKLENDDTFYDIPGLENFYAISKSGKVKRKFMNEIKQYSEEEFNKNTVIKTYKRDDNGKFIDTCSSLNHLYRITFTKYKVDGINWKYIPGTKNLYAASRDGRILNIYRQKLVSQVYGRGNYLQFTIHDNGVRTHMSVHRAIALTFIPNLNNLPTVNHKNNIRTDNRVENLEWCSMKYNNVYNDRAKKAGESNSFTLFIYRMMKRDKLNFKTPFNIDDGINFDKEFCTVSDKDYIFPEDVKVNNKRKKKYGIYFQ